MELDSKRIELARQTARHAAKSEVQSQPDIQSQSESRVCTVLRLKHYGVHKQDTLFAQSLGDFNVIAVDPGHVDLICIAQRLV